MSSLSDARLVSMRRRALDEEFKTEWVLFYNCMKNSKLNEQFKIECYYRHANSTNTISVINTCGKLLEECAFSKSMSFQKSSS
jgi:hypothetical protein